MVIQNRPWLQLFILSFLGMGILVACQPSAAPTEENITVQTVVVTEIVEGEAVQVIVTATPPSEVMEEEPVQEPTDEPPIGLTEASGFEEPLMTQTTNSTPIPVPSPTTKVLTLNLYPTPVDIEDRRIEVEWPIGMTPNESASVRLSFNPIEGGFEIVTEYPNDQLQVTEVVVKQLADYELSAIAKLDSIGFMVSPNGEQPRIVTPGESLTWHWTIMPKQSGEQRLSISLSLHWKSLSGTSQSREAVIYSKGLSVQVGVSPTPRLGNGIAAMVCMGAVAGIGVLILGVMVVRRTGSRAVRAVATPVDDIVKSKAISTKLDAPNEINIEPPHGVSLSPTETTLLSGLFGRYARLVIEREFLSGYSGARTFLAVPIRPDSRVDAHTIVKIADQQSVQREYQNYENFVKTTLPPATARIQQPPVHFAGMAALQYTFLGGAGNTPTSLRQALVENPNPRLLWKLFDTFAPNWWMQHKPYVFRLGQEYDRKLPTHFVLEPVDNLGASSVTPDAILDGKKPPGSVDEISPGMILALKNFPHIQARPDGKSISLTGYSLPGHPPLRARWNAPLLGANPVGRITATRWTILQEARAGMNLYNLPDPLEKLPALLGERVNGTQSLVHGDLNVENVLVGPSEWVWLIDFAETRDGHTLFDFAHLYAELIAHVIAPQIPHPPDYLEILRDDAEPLLAAVREMAARCLFDPKLLREFDLALVVSCVGALKYVNLTHQARYLLYLTAAHLVQYF